MSLFKSCRELGGIDIFMIYVKDSILVQICCILLKSSPSAPLRQDHSAIALSPTGQKLSWDPSVLLSSDEVQSLGDVGLHRIQMT